MTDLQVIPGVGPSIKQDLVELGCEDVESLRSRDPQELFDRLAEMRGGYMDRCVLYVFRCAVYFARNEQHDPDLLKWWNWKSLELDGSDPVEER